MSNPVRVGGHRRRRADRLRAAVPHRQRAAARPRHSPSTCGCSRSRDALKAAEGTAMELDDCAFPLLAGDRHHDDPNEAFDGVNVGAARRRRPRTKGMERADLLEANGGIFKPQGKAIERPRRRRREGPRRRQPGEHQRLIAHEQRAGHPARALHRDDPAGPQPRDRPARRARPAPRSPTSRNMAIWGNHSPTQYPDIFHAKVRGKQAAEVVDDSGWSRTTSSRRRQARRGDHRGARRLLGRLGGQRGDRPRARLGPRHARRRLGLDGACRPTAPTACPRGSSRLPVHAAGRRVRDRPGPRGRRVLARQHRRDGRGARRGARRRRSLGLI